MILETWGVSEPCHDSSSLLAMAGAEHSAHPRGMSPWNRCWAARAPWGWLQGNVALPSPQVR